MNPKTAPDKTLVNMADGARALTNLPTQTVSNNIEMDHTFPHFDYRCLGVSMIGDTGKAQGKPIEFPVDSSYDITHGQNTAKAAVAFLSYMGPAVDTVEERRALWTAGLFHDIGRQEYLGVPDPDHGRRGAELTERILKAHPSYWSDVKLIERVTRLIADHSKQPHVNDDPLRRALWDADCMEACRYRPGTGDGLAYWKERRALTVTEWGRDVNKQRKYMLFRGWK